MDAASDAICPDELVPHGKLGLIGVGEYIIRFVTSPNHFNKKGELKIGVLPPTHLAKGKGISVSRADYLTSERIGALALMVARSRSDEEEPKGVLKALVAEIRSIKTEENSPRCLCVVDDPTKDDDTHAVIFANSTIALGDFEEIRNILFEIMGCVMSFEECKNPNEAL